MRFPFTLMGLIAALAGLWALAYVVTPHHLDPLANGLAAGSGLALLGFGGYLLYRRMTRGPQG
jgi:hypothetical protein